MELMDLLCLRCPRTTSLSVQSKSGDYRTAKSSKIRLKNKTQEVAEEETKESYFHSN